MRWRVVWAPAATRDLRRLDRQTEQRIRTAVERLALTDRGDLKKLGGNEWRLRVGGWRVRFDRHDATRTIEVLRVLPRGRTYRR